MIGKLLGHTQVQTTARYAHLGRDTVKASAARIGVHIDDDPAPAKYWADSLDYVSHGRASPDLPTFIRAVLRSTVALVVLVEP